MYKLPKDKNSPKPQIREGYGQMYMDANNPNLALSNVWLSATDHAIAYTLQQIYENSVRLVNTGNLKVPVDTLSRSLKIN